jgi:hypothetical protein
MTPGVGQVCGAIALPASVVFMASACGSDTKQQSLGAQQFEFDVAVHGVPSSRVSMMNEKGQTLGDAVCADVEGGQAPGNVAIGLNNLEGSNRFTMPESLVVTYWAIKDICPDQIGNGVKEGWKDDVDNPPPTDGVEPPWIGAPSVATPTAAPVPCEAQ